MTKRQLQVKEWHEKFGAPVHKTPQCTIPKERALLRAKLIFEEAVETIEAMGCRINNGLRVALDESGEFNLNDVVDGLCDLGYVCDGAALEFGVDMDPAEDECHRSNMSKMWTADDIASDAFQTGMVLHHAGKGKYVVRRADGKILKPPSYSPADFQKVIDDQIGRP